MLTLNREYLYMNMVYPKFQLFQNFPYKSFKIHWDIVYDINVKITLIHTETISA